MNIVHLFLGIGILIVLCVVFITITSSLKDSITREQALEEIKTTGVVIAVFLFIGVACMVGISKLAD